MLEKRLREHPFFSMDVDGWMDIMASRMFGFQNPLVVKVHVNSSSYPRVMPGGLACRNNLMVPLICPFSC